MGNSTFTSGIKVALGASVLVGGCVAFAAPAGADCQGGWTPWGGGSYCDGAVYADGSYDHCVETTVLGFGGMQCGRVCPADPANPGVPLPWTDGVSCGFR